MTLWILFCQTNNNLDTLFPFYARDCEQAEEKATEILEKHPSYEGLGLKVYPRGFTMAKAYIPGTIEEDVQKQPM